MFMLISSIALLIGMIGVFYCGRSFDLSRLPGLLREKCSPGAALCGAGKAFFVILMIAMLIRMAAVPLHTWILDVHDEAPSPISMMLAALIQTTAAYGIFRIAYPLFPHAAGSLWRVLALLGVGNILYGALCTIRQAELKRLAAVCIDPADGFRVARGSHGDTRRRSRGQHS